MSIEKLGQYFVAVEDPRCSGKVEHRLVEVLVVAVCAVITCAESWDDIALYGRSKLAWLRTFLELANGIPSHDTFRRVFMLIDPDAFEAGFAAWASKQGLVLGQRCVEGKSNEITAVPELLDQLALENSIVTLDAMGCQTAIAEKILARGGDYLLTLKGNHPLAHAAVVAHFDQQCFRRGAPGRADCDDADESHGRLVRRRVFASIDAAALDALSGWSGLHTVLAVETICRVNGTSQVDREVRATCCRAALTVRPSWARRSAHTGR